MSKLNLKRALPLSFFLFAIWAPVAFAGLGNNIFDAEFSNMRLELNGNRQVPFQSSALQAGDLANGQGINLSGQVQVTRGQLTQIQLVANNNQVPVSLQQTGGQLYRMNAVIPIQPGVPSFVFLIVRGADSSGRQMAAFQYPQAPIQLFCQREPFRAQFTDTQWILNSGQRVPFGNLSLKSEDMAGSTQLRVVGKIQVQAGELYHLDLLTDHGSQTMLQKGQQPQPFYSGSYDWQSGISIQPGQLQKVTLRAAGFNPQTQSEAESIVYPGSPAEVNYGAGPLNAEVSEVTLLLNDGHHGARAVPFQNLTLKDTDLMNNAVGVRGKLKVRQGRANSLLLHQDSRSTVVSIGTAGALNIGEYNWGTTIPLEKGRSSSVYFSVEGVDTKTGAPSPSIPYPPGAVTLKYEAPLPPSAFQASFTGLSIGIMNESGRVDKKFEDISAEGLLVEADSGIGVEISAQWKVSGGVLDAVQISQDGGQNWQAFDVKNAKQTFSFPVVPSKELRFSMRLIGHDTQNGRPQGDARFIADTRQAYLRLRKYQLIPFSGAITKMTYKAGSQAEKAIPVLPALESVRFELDKDVPVDVTVEWKTDGGSLRGVEVSRDNGAHWEGVVANPPSAGTVKKTYAVAPNSEAIFAARLVGYDLFRNQPGGDVKTVNGSFKAVVANKKAVVSVFDPVFSNQTLKVGAGQAVPFAGPSSLSVETDTVDVTIGGLYDLRGASISAAYASRDGGKTWDAIDLSRLYLRDLRYDYTLPAGGSYDFVFRVDGHDHTDTGQNVGALKQKVDAKHAVVSFKKLDAGVPLENVSLTDLAIGTSGGYNYSFNGYDRQGHSIGGPGGSDLQLAEAQMSGLVLHGKLENKSGFAIDRVEVSMDGGKTWNKVAPSADWQWPFKAQWGSTYDIWFRVIAKYGGMAGPDKFSKGRVRFTKLAYCTIEATMGHESIDTLVSGALLISNYQDPDGRVSIRGRVMTYGGLDRVEISLDGGKSWELLTRNGVFGYSFPPALRKDYDLRFRYTDKDGTVETDNLPKAHFSFVRTLQDTTPPPAKISDAVLSNAIPDVDEWETNLDKIGDEIALPERTVGRDTQMLWMVDCPAPIKVVRVSLDGGTTWADARPASDQGGLWGFHYKPTVGRDYAITFKVVLQDGREADTTGYPKKHFRFVKLVRVPAFYPAVNPLMGLVLGGLQDAGFKAQVEYEDTKDPSLKGCVLRMNPVAGAWAKSGSTVTVVVGGQPPATASKSEDPWAVLQGMARAYENKDFSAFIARVSDDFPNRGEFEEFVRRDFRDYDSVKINLYQKRLADIPGGQSVQADWDLQYFPTTVTKQIRLTGSGLDFLFVDENGKLKLKNMRGANPLFGARSPDVAAASGVSTTAAQVLQKIEDSGSRASKAAALAIAAGQIQSGIESLPVTFEILSVSARYDDFVDGSVNLDAVTPGRPIKAEARVRIVDNPKNIDFNGIQLVVTDSVSGATLTVTGNIPANQEVVFSTDQDITVPAPGVHGTLTFVLDPNDKFIAIDRSLKTVRVSYSS